MKKILYLGLLFILNLSFAAEDSLYNFSWLDKDKEIYVLQNRKFRKVSNVYLAATMGRSLTGAFIDSNEFTLNAGYFLTENWGFEVSYISAKGETNKTHDGIESQGSVAFFRKIETANTFTVYWSPFYSKINTFNQIFYYDWMFGLGLANITTLDNRNEFDSPSQADELTEETNSGITWASTWRFFINKNWSTRIDIRGIHVNADSVNKEDGETSSDATKAWFNYYNLNIGLIYNF